MIRLLSLCSGMGGAELGLICADLHHQIRPTQFVEIDSYCQKILKKNFPTIPIHDNLFTFSATPGEFELIVAGFPCQPHSLAGKRKASKDARDLWGEVYRIILEAKPTGILLENVPGLRTSESGNFFKRVVGQLTTAGYVVEWGHNSVAGVGGVNRRKRIWILAYTKGDGWAAPRSAIATKERANQTPVNGGVARQAWWLQAIRQVCISDDGIPAALDRCLMRFDTLADWLPHAADNADNPLRKRQLIALGNAIVPQQIAPIWQRLYNKVFCLPMVNSNKEIEITEKITTKI